MDKALKVFFSPNIQHHPDFQNYNPEKKANFEDIDFDTDAYFSSTPKFKSQRLLLSDNGLYYLLISSKDIINYIVENSYYILEIDWHILKFDNTKILLDKSTVYQVKPFDNASFWKYGTHKIKGMNAEFIRNNKKYLNFSYDENIHIRSKVTNHYFEHPIKLSLSQKEDLPWSYFLINEFDNYWNWNYLTLNKGINWTVDLITKFENEINFQTLSLREDIDWSIGLICKYEDRWNWMFMSGNSSLPWCYSFIKRFEDKWTWSSDTKSTSKYTNSEKTVTSFYVSEYLLGKEYHHLKPISISHNSGIIWDIDMQEFINKIDVWSIAANAYMSQTFIALVHEQLSIVRHIHSYWLKNSDWPREEVAIQYSGWDLIRRNHELYYKIQHKIAQYEN